MSDFITRDIQREKCVSFIDYFLIYELYIFVKLITVFVVINRITS